jgi:hypothetical protein
MIQYYFLAQVWNGTQFFDQDGKPLAGGKIATYSAGSMSLQALTYADSTGDVENPNPIVLDSSGRIPCEMWLDTNSVYQFVLYKPDGETVLQACDNIGTHDPYPDMTGHSGEFLQAVSGIDVQWASPLPPTGGQDGKVLMVGEGGTSVMWGSELPDQAGHSGLFLTTNGTNTSWATAGGGGGSAPEEFICTLSSPWTQYTDSIYNYSWNATVLQESTECTVNDFGTEADAVFTLTTPGIYKVTITGRYRGPGYPSQYLPDAITIYGIQVLGADYNFNLSSHSFGQAGGAWGWSNLNGYQNQMEWTDTFYVENYAGGATFTVGSYAVNDNQIDEYNSACMVSVVRTNGTIWPNNV